MFIKSISLQNFRCYKSNSFNFKNQTTVLLGLNGIGKTSIVEAVFLLSNGSSFRASRIEEMINFDQDLARVKALITNDDEGVDSSLDSSLDELDELELEMILTKGIVQGKKARRSVYLVNQIKRRKKDFVANFYAVVFRPEDLRLVEGSPGRRRNFMNAAIAAVDRNYSQAFKIYEQTLKRRNKLLFDIKEGKLKKSVLTYWNQSLIKNGQILQEKRKNFFEFLMTIDFPLDFSVDYQPSVISEKRIAQYIDKEMIVGYTLIGPHKDDFDIKLKDLGNRSLASFGSRGQQRMGVLWLKIGELEYLKRKIDRQPVLLLDDILSELDDVSRDKVLSLLGKGQAIVTTTDTTLIKIIEQKVGEINLVNL